MDGRLKMPYDFETFFYQYIDKIKDEEVRGKMIELKEHFGMFYTQFLRTPEEYQAMFDGRLPWEEVDVDNADTMLC